MNHSSDIHFEILPGAEGNLGLVTLQRQSALNALTQTMLRELHHTLDNWANNPEIKAVVIRAAEGRAFCAGGDIRHIYEAGQRGDMTVNQFFWDEYRLNHCIHHFPKPYIALLDGITMGGGVGISIHGSHRVGTENLSFAMPETGIGFFPDVGGSFFLPRLPQSAGYYLGLTGARIDAHDALNLGILTQSVSSHQLNDIIDTLCVTPLKTAEDVDAVLNKFSVAHPASEHALDNHIAALEQCFSQPTIEHIIAALQSQDEPWPQKTEETLLKKSPTSLKVTLEQLQRGSKLNFDACMQMEYRMVNHYLRGHDLFEGVRAVIIDKDGAPHWQPAAIEDVTDGMVALYFQPISTEELHFN